MIKKFSEIIFFITIVLFGTINTIAQKPNFKALINGFESVKKSYIPDSRVAIFEISFTDTLSNRPIINGKTNIPEIKTALQNYLATKEIDFVDSLKVLPNSSLGENTWALITLTGANMRSKPSHSSELLSQVYTGTPVRVFDYHDGWYQVQSPDKYIGWIEGNGVASMSSSEIETWKKSNRYVFNTIQGLIYEKPNTESAIVGDLVLGSILEVLSVQKSFLEVKLPDGRTGFAHKKDFLSWSDWISKQAEASNILKVAEKMIGIPYLWGGTSTKAVDCSGFTKITFFSSGIIIARDASQQALYGFKPDFKDIKNLQPGDLLFFGRSASRVTHVGIYRGNGFYIHSSGRVRINSIDPENKTYNVTDIKNLVGVSRILNSLDTDGITLVKNHPWYN